MCLTRQHNVISISFHSFILKTNPFICSEQIKGSRGKEVDLYGEQTYFEVRLMRIKKDLNTYVGVKTNHYPCLAIFELLAYR